MFEYPIVLSEKCAGFAYKVLNPLTIKLDNINTENNYGVAHPMHKSKYTNQIIQIQIVYLPMMLEAQCQEKGVFISVPLIENEIYKITLSELLVLLHSNTSYCMNMQLNGPFSVKRKHKIYDFLPSTEWYKSLQLRCRVSQTNFLYYLSTFLLENTEYLDQAPSILCSLLFQRDNQVVQLFNLKRQSLKIPYFSNKLNRAICIDENLFITELNKHMQQSFYYYIFCNSSSNFEIDNIPIEKQNDILSNIVILQECSLSEHTIKKLSNTKTNVIADKTSLVLKDCNFKHLLCVTQLFSNAVISGVLTNTNIWFKMINAPCLVSITQLSNFIHLDYLVLENIKAPYVYVEQPRISTNNLRIISTKIPSLIDILINTDMLKVYKTKTVYLQDNKISAEKRNALIQIGNQIKKIRKTFSLKIVENS